MKSGQVAVENSVVNPLRKIDSGKLKTRSAMVSFGSPSRQQKRGHLQPTLTQFHPHLFVPAQVPYHPQQLAMLQSHPAVQPVPMYQRYGTNGVIIDRVGVNHTINASQIQHHHRQPPPLPPQDSAITRSTKSSEPPVSVPVQLQASPSMSMSRARPKRNVCTRFTRGTCYFGAACKFFHDESGSSDIPRSAPALIDDQAQVRISPVPCDRLNSNHSDIPSSLHDSNFPSLSAETSGSDKPNARNVVRTLDKQLCPSPPKTLVFRDAVMQHTRKRGEVKSCDGTQPDKNPSCSEDEVSKIPDDTDSAIHLGSRNDGERLPKSERNCQRDARDEGTNEILQDNCDVAKSTGSKPGRRESHSRAPRFPGRPNSIQPFFPQSGQAGYAIQPVCSTSQSTSLEDFPLSSYTLSRDVDAFVRRVDSRLRSVVYVQQRAIAKLQEVASSLWCDSIIDIYGSSFTRLALPHSDIDCVLLSPLVAREQPAEVLARLAAAVQSQPWARRVDLLSNAKIPVLKIVFCQSSKSTHEVMLDLTCAHSPGHSGLSARDLIYSYQAEMPALRPLVLILKTHIQRRGLNSAYTGGLSSYGLVLLVIRFLQACGDEHHVGEIQEEQCEDMRRENMSPTSYAYRLSGTPPIFEFTRDGKMSWRTTLGNLLLLFLETYVTFDYRRFGITIEGNGQYFPLPSDKVTLEPAVVVSPYISDPVEPTRTIGNCFRMHDVVQAWYDFYVKLTNGVSINDAIGDVYVGNTNNGRHAISSA